MIMLNHLADLMRTVRLMPDVLDMQTHENSELLVVAVVQGCIRLLVPPTSTVLPGWLVNSC